MIDKWNFSECFNFAEKCSVSIKAALGRNGNSVNVGEEKFQFCRRLQYCVRQPSGESRGAKILV